MGDSTPMVFDKLTIDNHNTWQVHVEGLLRVHDIWDYVKEDEEFVLRDADRKNKDQLTRSILMLHVSSSLVPLVQDCMTSRKVWLELANICGNKDEKKHEESLENSDTDEDGIINDIEVSVDDFFKTINASSEKKLMEDKKLLSKIFTDNLFSQLMINGVTGLPDEKIISNTISDFIDVIDELSKKEIEERTNELSSELIDILLVKFNINPHKNCNDEAEINVDKTEIQDNDVDGGKNTKSRVSNELNSFDARDVAGNRHASDYYAEVSTNTVSRTVDKIYDEWLQNYDEKIPRELHGRQVRISTGLYTPPPTPDAYKRTYKCGICREEGHNRTKCPLNRPPASTKTTIVPKTPLNKPESYAPKSTAKTPESSKKLNKCGICGVEGHNRTTCSLNKSADSASKCAAETTATPKTSLNGTASYVPKTTVHTPETPKISYKCGICGDEGHNRTTCPLTESADSMFKSAAIKTTATPKTSLNETATYVPKTTVHTPETPKRSYKCGICGDEGHNRTYCPLNNSGVSTSKYRTAIEETPKKSYKCGGCGNEGHNITSCPGNSVKSTASAKSSYRCGTCGAEGHNSRTCGRNATSSYVDHASSPSYSLRSSFSSDSSPAPSYSGGGRSYSCGRCGGSGHNSRTCQG